MKYDMENLLADIEVIMKANLNTKIAAINSEKNDGVTLSTIQDGAYYFQSLDFQQVNFDPYIFYGLESIDEDGSGNNFGHTAERLVIAVAVILADEGQSIDVPKKLFRYQRALKEIFEENFNKLPNGEKIAVQGQVPIDLSLQNNAFRSKAIGVTLKVAMG